MVSEYQGSYDLRRDVDKLINKKETEFVDYVLKIDVPIVTYKDEDFTPATITATSYKVSHDGTDFYNGRLYVEISTDGSTYTTPTGQEGYVEGHSRTFEPNDLDITNIRFTLKDDEDNILDRETATVVRTVEGVTGKGYDFIYYTTEKTTLNEQTDYPDNSTSYTQLDGDFNQWLQRPKQTDATHPNIFMSFRVSSNGDSWGNWSTPVRYSGIGEKGEDGEGVEFIFTRTETPSPVPQFPVDEDGNQGQSDYAGTDRFGHTYDQADFQPDGWTDDQQGVSDATGCKYEWASSRTKDVTNGVASWSDFNTPTIWANWSEDGEDAIVLAIGNESQQIPTDSNGDLIEEFTCEIPFYCYKGITKHPCTYNKSRTYTPDWLDISGVQNATASNDGKLRATISDTPDYNDGYVLLSFTVDGVEYNRTWSYSKSFKGPQGDEGPKGEDGDGYHYIYFRTTTNVKPQKPADDIDPVDNSSGISGENLPADSWFEDAVSPTAQFPYLWTSVQIYNGSNETWGPYSEPYLFQQYVFYGTDGNKGNTGVHGVDGYVLDGDDVEDKTTDVTSKTMNNSVPSNFVSQQFNQKEYTLGNYTTYLNRQGNIVLINLAGSFTVSGATESQGQYLPVISLESWAFPIQTTYFDDVVNDRRYRVRNDGGTPKLEIWATSNDNGRTFIMASSVMYFADDTQRPQTTINNLTASTIGQGEPAVVQLLDDNGNPMDGETVYIKINGVIYQRVTDSNGLASVNMNLFTGVKDGFLVSAWYDGHTYRDGEIQGLSEYRKCSTDFKVYVKQAIINSIDWLTDDEKGYYAQIKTNTGVELRYHDVELSIDGGEKWVTQTDGKGRVFYDLMGYDKDVEILLTVPESDRVYKSVTEKHMVIRSDLEIFTKTYYPSAIESNGNFENISDAKALSCIGDMNYVSSIEAPYNMELQELVLDYDLDLPLSATIQYIEVEVRFCGLEGDKQLQRPSWKAPELRLYQEERYITLDDRPSGVVCDYKNCGKWQTVTYSKELNTLDIAPSNFTGLWKNIKLGLSDLINYGGGDNHRDSGRFAVDYVSLRIDYTADNEVSLIPDDIPSVQLFAEDIIMYQGDGTRYFAKLEIDGETAENKTIKIYLNGVEYTRTTDSGGWVTLGLNLNPANYGITATYEENGTIITRTNTIIIKPRIVARPLKGVTHCGLKFEVEIYNEDGSPATNEEITFNIMGVMYPRTSNSEGVARLNINLNPGTYNITAIWQGFMASEEIEVTPALTANDLYMQYRDGSQFVAHLVDCQNQPMQGAVISFNVNGVFYQKITDANGDAKLSINLLPGTYIITSQYQTGSSGTSSISNKITILDTGGKHMKSVHISRTNGRPDYADAYGTDWTSATPECTYTKGDGAHIVTMVLNPNVTANTLIMTFEPNIPDNSTVQSMKVTVTYAGLKGVPHTDYDENDEEYMVDEGGVYHMNDSTLKLIRGDGITIGVAQALPRRNISEQNSIDEVWYDTEYNFKINQSYSTGLWLQPQLVLEGIKNVGEHTGRFGIDYVNIEITYITQ